MIGVTEPSSSGTTVTSRLNRSATASSAARPSRVPIRRASSSVSVKANFGSTFPPAPWKKMHSPPETARTTSRIGPGKSAE